MLTIISACPLTVTIFTRKTGARGEASVAVTAYPFKRKRGKIMETLHIHRFSAAQPETYHIKESTQVP